MRTLKTVLVGFFAIALAGRVAADWPQFRGPKGQGISTDKGVPLTWGPDKNIVWKADLPGAGVSSPIVFGDKIFITCYSGFRVPGQAGGSMEQLTRHVACLDRKTGKQLWSKTVPSRLPDQPTIREDHGYATSTPIADSERVYAFFGKSGVVALDHTGKHLWHADVGDKLNGWGSAAPLALHDDLVLVNASVECDALIALDKGSGKEVWRTPKIQECWHQPMVVEVNDESEIVMACIQRVFGIDPANGEKLWTCNSEIGWYMVPNPVVHDSTIYLLGGRSGVTSLAIRAGGCGDVTASHRVWKSNKGSNVPSPIFHNGHVYWMNDNNGIAYCAEAKTGRVVYEERVPGAAGVYASPIMAEGRIYYTDRMGKTFVVAAEPTYKLLATNVLGKRINVNASPAVVDGRILMRADSVLYCIGEK